MIKNKQTIEVDECNVGLKGFRDDFSVLRFSLEVDRYCFEIVDGSDVDESVTVEV